MARFVRAGNCGRVLPAVARTSRAMTIKTSRAMTIKSIQADALVPQSEGGSRRFAMAAASVKSRATAALPSDIPGAP